MPQQNYYFDGIKIAETSKNTANIIDTNSWWLLSIYQF